jgi:O-antigen ligase
MENKYYFILLIFIIAFFRFINCSDKNKKKELHVSFAIQILSLGFGLKLLSFSNSYHVDMIGAFGDSIRIELVTFVSFYLIFIGYYKFDRIKIENSFLFVLILLIIAISFLNPLNIIKPAIWSPISYYFQVWVLFHLIKSNFNISEIFKGIYDAFFVLTIFQLTLSICYPILGMTFIGTLFVDTLDFSLRREGIVSAMGTYGHPSSLAMICLTYAVFFITCYWHRYKRKLSLYLFMGNMFVVYLTYSRTTYLIAFFIFIIAFNLYKGQLFKVKNIISLGIASLFLILIVNFTTFGDLFLKSDSDSQVSNRMTHWFLGYELWQKSELIGLGINSHVLYMQNKLDSTKLGEFAELQFYLSNPIHNIHIIVLVESGLIGLFTWFYFFFIKLKQTFKQAYLKFIPFRILNITAFSVLLIVFTYGFMGWGTFLKETSVMFLLLIFFSKVSNGYLNKYSSQRKSDLKLF